MLAAAFKIFGIASDPAFEGQWAKLVLIELELLVGLSLLIGFVARLTRVVAAIIFAVFLLYSLTQAFNGARNCGCLGKIELSPWLAALVDGLVLAVLGFWRPKEESCRVLHRLCWVLPVAALGGAASLWIASSTPFPRITVEPHVVDLGVVSQGAQTDLKFILRNPHSQPVAISRIESSCPCIQPVVRELSIPSRGENTLSLRFDLRKGPSAAGTVLLRITGHVDSGELAFVALVRAYVPSI